MNEHERKIHDEAIAFSRKNRVRIARELTDPAVYVPDPIPISVFMAGSPGAGKTEFSRRLIEALEKGMEHRVVRIDSDEIRGLMPGYTGDNSYLFQGAISLVIEKIYDFVLDNKQTFIFDGTLSKYEKARLNIQRSLNHKRPTFIFFVYQRPEIAWKFTVAREKDEGRKIPRSAFIEQFIGSRETVNRLLEEFSSQIQVNIVVKNFEKDLVDRFIDVPLHEKSIDRYLDRIYTKAELEKII